MVYSPESDLSSLDVCTIIEEGKPMEELDKIPVCEANPSKELKIGHELQKPTRG